MYLSGGQEEVSLGDLLGDPLVAVLPLSGHPGCVGDTRPPSFEDIVVTHLARDSEVDLLVPASHPAYSLLDDSGGLPDWLVPGWSPSCWPGPGWDSG